MNDGKHLAKRTTLISRSRKSSRKRRYRLTMPALLAILLVVFTIGGTMAFLITHTDPVENKFSPASVSCAVEEEFNGTTKSNVTVKNTSDILAYVRVKLISYRVNGEDNHRIGGSAEIPSFTLGNGWVKYGEYYYYTIPVNAGATPTSPLIGSAGINLQSYTDKDGGKQVIEVIAEAIQSEPSRAVGEAWGVSISASGVTAYSAGN